MTNIYLAILAGESMKRQRVFRDRMDPLDHLDDTALFRRYRLPRHCLLDLIREMEPHLERTTQRSHSLPVSIQVLCALRFYAGGCFQKDSGDIHGISQSSASRCIDAVSTVFCGLSKQYIKFPSGVIETREIMASFYNLGKFPNVLGCVDGTQIAIVSPSTNEHLYVCRKGFHSINVQVVCGADMKFLNVVSKWPGSTHDSFVWSNSQISNFMEHRSRIGSGGWLLGDSGYPLRPFLMTPVLNEQTEGEKAYNRSHKRTRSIVERSIGQMKTRFRCLDRTGGCLMFTPERAAKTIIACAVLHNICILNKIPEVENEDVEIDVESSNESHTDNSAEGRTARAELIRMRFD